MADDHQHGQPDLAQSLVDWRDGLEPIRQNGLLDEGAFITFAKRRGIAVWGVISGDPGKLFKRGWLASDGVRENKTPLFHPFRVYPLHRVTF